MSLQKHIEENYERIVAAGDRTYDDIADQAEKDGSPALVSWARGRAAAGCSTSTSTDQLTTAQSVASLNIEQLKDEAKKRSIETKSSWLKQAYIDAIEEFDAEAAKKASAETDGLYADVDDEHLGKLLELRGLSTDGERADLIARLQEADTADGVSTPEELTQLLTLLHEEKAKAAENQK